MLSLLSHRGSAFKGSIRWEVKHGTYLASAYLISLLHAIPHQPLQASASSASASASSDDDVIASQGAEGNNGFSLDVFTSQMVKLGVIGLKDEIGIVRIAACSLIETCVNGDASLPNKHFHSLVTRVLELINENIMLKACSDENSSENISVDQKEEEEEKQGGGGLSVEYVSLLATLFSANNQCRLPEMSLEQQSM